MNFKKFINMLGLFCLMSFLIIACSEVEVEPIKITVEDITVSVEENSEQGKLLGQLQASSNRGTLTFSLSDISPSGAISIDEENGAITIDDSSGFDFEANPVITAVGNVSVENIEEAATITINLIDVDEVEIEAIDFNGDVDENSPNGTIIGQVEASITSGSGTLNFSIISQLVPGAITINGSGELIVANSDDFDHEFNSILNGTYRATNGSISRDADFTININNIDEHVVVADDFTANIDENSPNGTVLGSVSASLTEDSGNLFYSIDSQSVAGAISINNNGEILIADVNAFDYEVNTQITGIYRAEVTGSTSPTGAATASITINLRDKATWSKEVYAGQVGTMFTTDGPRLDARFRTPKGIDFDADGNLYIADFGNNRIRKIDINGNVSTVAGSSAGFADGANANALFQSPSDLEIDGIGNIWVVDQGNRKVRIINANETNSSQTTAFTFVPKGIAIAGNTVFISKDHAIDIVNRSSGALTSFVGSNTAGFADGSYSETQFNSPIGLAVNSQEELFVADFNNRRVRKLSGGLTSSFPGAYFQISDLAVAADDRIYAVETGNQRVRIVTTTTDGAADEILIAGLNRPEGIAINPTTGEIFVSDAGDHVIYKLSKEEE
jgi:sugar lactone lactonase YvrE